MNFYEVKKILEENFNAKPSDGNKRNIFFWYDGEREFADDIHELQLDNAKILHLNDNNAFYIKHHLEKVDLESNYLLYFPFAKPVGHDNWLLDILKYSTEFSTDKAVLIMRDVGAEDPSLRNVFKKHLKFFANKERYNKFTSYGIDSYTEDGVNIAIMAALCRLPVADFEQVVKNILMDRIGKENKSFEAIKTFGDVDAFWSLVEKRYGYTYEDKSLEKLTVMLLATHLEYSLEEKLPKTWSEYVSLKKSDCIVFVSNFMSHAVDGRAYDLLADRVEELLKIEEYIDRWDIDKYLGCDTFRAFDRRIISKITRNLLEGVQEFDQYRHYINSRRTNHWFDHFRYEYEALYYAVLLLELEKKIGAVIPGQSAFELAEHYTNKFYLFDQFYRKFYLNYDQIKDKELFSRLSEKIENTYAHWYLNELSVKWSGAVEEELLLQYQIPGLIQQRDFYEEHVKTFVKKEERVFVIISDALRYEAGVELLEELNKELRGAATISSLLGVVPSTTKYGMAGLLPAKKITVNEKAEVLVDDINTQGTANRQKIISSYSEDALAIQYQDMVDLKRPEYKELFEGKKLLYIYHNVIDAVGDKQQTERNVFEAVERAIQEIVQLVNNLVNHVSATNIIITADHGFIYRRSPLTEVDKISKHKVAVLDSGRRFILSDAAEEMEDSLPISMAYLLGKETGLKAVVPKGVIRYKVQGGGENYAHGGAALQEIILPVVRFKNIRKDVYKAKKVEVKLTNISRKITNRITYLEFFQVDLVGEKKIPLKLKLYFEDEENNRISNENIIIADSRSKNPQDRTFREKFTLRDIPYEKTKKYYLVLEDEEETVEKIYDRIPYTIDLIISDDFGL